MRDVVERPYRASSCEDCKVDTHEIREYALVLKDEIWIALGEPPFLCVGCIEKRLGRKLTPQDFAFRNPLCSSAMFTRSERLVDRMGAENIERLHDPCQNQIGRTKRSRFGRTQSR